MAINKAVDKSAKSKAAMRNAIEYILKESKILDGYTYVTGPYPYEVIDYDHVMKAFFEEKEIWDKTDGRLYSHNIISFSKDENITAEQAYEFGAKFAEEWFKDFSTLVAVHQDKEHVHIHMISNTVSYIDGHKYQCSNADLKEMKQFTNEMCRERGLTVAEKGCHFDGTKIEKGEIISWDKNTYRHLLNETKDSYLAECGMAVMNAAEQSTNQDEFIALMKSQGWEVEWNNRKHITFKDDEGHKIRDSRIEKTFHIEATKKGLEYEFTRKTSELAEKESRRTEQQHTHHIRR